MIHGLKQDISQRGCPQRAHKEDVTRTEGLEKGLRQVTEVNKVDKRPQRSRTEKKGWQRFGTSTPGLPEIGDHCRVVGHHRQHRSREGLLKTQESPKDCRKLQMIYVDPLLLHSPDSGSQRISQKLSGRCLKLVDPIWQSEDLGSDSVENHTQKLLPLAGKQIGFGPVDLNPHPRTQKPKKDRKSANHPDSNARV
ncbi:hypothetical protein E2C01_051310 [Portunus trituberculatus]|uniref:Uncharacterized protein n=1 Tax=Portunus trituberculatus TaxID=210409 RepID=A0A5B7GEE5_PORTR|nr:hypothetical protein [Portunus trituberculatus]